ncbi:MAG TPA: hypothetical protein VFA07_06410 [Chthonomonadaceae bacterium]|nr:hypothetical protein [Chthonomonadaceae bacterium]
MTDTFEPDFHFVYRHQRILVGKEAVPKGCSTEGKAFAMRICLLSQQKDIRVLNVPDAALVYQQGGALALQLLVKHHLDKRAYLSRQKEGIASYMHA